MAVSLSTSLNAKNSVPLPGGRCKYTGQSVLKHYCCIEDVQIRSNPKNARKVSLSASLNTKSSVPLSGGRCKYTGQSVRALPIRILTVGKKRSRGVQLIVDEYIEKLKHYCRIEDVQIRSNPKNASDVMAQVEHEDMAFMYLIKSDDWVVMLDELGLDIRSEQMAELIGDAGNTGASSLLFCIGGPYGHGRQLRQRANVSIKLSSLVLNHQIALVVLMEQLYRAWTILKGQKYHH